MDRILDIDLDYFVWPILYLRGSHLNRPSETDFTYVASEIEVRQFLEERCGLNSSMKLIGTEVVEHVEAFFLWDRWISEGKLSCQFDVIHVDAHADLGFGGCSWDYLMTELLARPFDERSHPRLGEDALNSGSYLAYAIGNRWVHSLEYIIPPEPKPLIQRTPSEDSSFEGRIGRLAQKFDQRIEDRRPEDLLDLLFEDGDVESNRIQLRRIRPGDAQSLGAGSKTIVPVHTEPPVPFKWMSGNEFRSDGFSHINVAQSPLYTPDTADHLLAVIREYFEPS